VAASGPDRQRGRVRLTQGPGNRGDHERERRPRPPVFRGRDNDQSTEAARVSDGIGLGGFVDGIVLHQILQWHHMASDTDGNPVSTVDGLETNTLLDGFFHLATWFFVAAAMILALRAWQRRELAPPWRGQFGMLLAGWGVFNLVEGLIDHQILGIHHVRDDLGAPLGWDIGFLVFGALLVIVGLLLPKSGEKIAHDHNDRQARRATGA
jgi:uncharacterized membrane protein